MKASLLRLAKLRATQHRQAELWVARVAADLHATERCAEQWMEEKTTVGSVRTAGQWQHDAQVVEKLQVAAQKLTRDLVVAQDEYKERARDAKQLAKIIEAQQEEKAKRILRAETQMVEAWGRNQRTTSPLSEDIPS
jgi:hypothetical protein